MHGKRSLLLRPSGEAQWVAQSGPINKRRSFGRVWGGGPLAQKTDIPQNKEKTRQSGTKKEVSETSRIRPSILLIGLILGERDIVLGDSPDLLLVGSSRIQDVTTKKRMPPPPPSDQQPWDGKPINLLRAHNKKIEIFRLVQIINGEIGEIKENPQRVVTHQGRAQRSDFLLMFSPFSFRFFSFLLFVSCILSFLLKLGGRTRAGLLLLHFFFANISPMEETLANFT